MYVNPLHIQTILPLHKPGLSFVHLESHKCSYILLKMLSFFHSKFSAKLLGGFRDKVTALKLNIMAWSLIAKQVFRTWELSLVNNSSRQIADSQSVFPYAPPSMVLEYFFLSPIRPSMNPFTNPSTHVANNCYVNTAYQALHSGLEIQRLKRQRTCLYIAHSRQKRDRPIKSTTDFTMR